MLLMVEFGTMKTGLLFVNQVVAPHLRMWLERYTAELGTVELWTGSRDSYESEHVVVRHALPYDRSSALRRFLTWSVFTMVVMVRLILGRRDKFLLVTTNPTLMPLAAWFLNCVVGQPYGIYEFDVYPQVAAVMGMFGQNSILFRIWNTLHRPALRRASFVVTLRSRMAAELMSICPEIDPPVTVIPNWVDTEWIQPLQRSLNNFAANHALQAKLVVGYAGNMGATHSVETILKVARFLREDPIQFLFIGDGTKKHLVEEAIRSGELPNVQLLPWFQYEHLAEPLASLDISVVTIASGYKDFIIPSKTINALSAGSAILGISRPPNDLEKLIYGGQCGANFSPDDVSGIAAWLREMSQSDDILDDLKRAARALALEQYRETKCAAELTAVVKGSLQSDAHAVRNPKAP